MFSSGAREKSILEGELVGTDQMVDSCHSLLDGALFIVGSWPETGQTAEFHINSALEIPSTNLALVLSDTLTETIYRAPAPNNSVTPEEVKDFVFEKVLVARKTILDCLSRRWTLALSGALTAP